MRVKLNGVDVFHPSTGEVRSDNADGIACWFIDTEYNEESFFVRHAYFLGADDPYKALKTTLKAEIDEDAWATLHSDTSRPFDKPETGRIAVKVINHLGDEVMKVFRVDVMQFLIADTFTDSLTRLTADEQKSVKTTAFDLQTNPAHPSLQFHRLDKAKDQELLVGAGRQRHPADRPQERVDARALLRRPPRQGVRVGRAAEARRRIRRPAPRSSSRCARPCRRSSCPCTSRPRRRRRCQHGRSSPISTTTSCSATASRAEWLDDVRRPTRTRSSLSPTTCQARRPRRCSSSRPAERRRCPPLVPAGTDPFEHPDAQRRFRVVENVEELERALDYPWERWMVFLHPAQREIVERDYSGPGAGLGLGGHRQDDRRAPSRRLPRALEPARRGSC